MEDIQNQLEALIVRTKNQKINIREIQALKKREKLFCADWKIKLAVLVAVFGIISYQSSGLIGKEKVVKKSITASLV